MEGASEYLAVFGQEASDQLQTWEQSLLALERHPDDRDELDSLFRAIHSLKGAAGFIGFERLARVAHELESTLSEVRDEGRTFDPRLGDILFRGLDLARGMIEKFTAGQESSADIDGFLGEVKAVDSVEPRPAAQDGARANGPRPNEEPARLDPRHSAGGEDIPKVSDNPRSEGRGSTPPQGRGSTPPQGRGSTPPETRQGTDPAPSTETPRSVLVLAVAIAGPQREAYLRSFLVKARLSRIGTIVESVPTPEELREQTGPFRYNVTVVTEMKAEAIVDSIAIDQVTVTVASVPAEPVAAEPVAPGPPSEPEPERQSPARPAPGAPRAPRASPVNQPSGPGFRPEEVVRVSVQKLDSLLNLVGELVIHNAGFAASTERLRPQLGGTSAFLDLESRIQALSAITRELQDGIMTARMLPIASVFSRFQRVVRDLAKSSGKQVSLEVSGGETELDKKVIDRIGEPLVHLVRNAVDHGIEPPEKREAAGKVRFGTVRLSARQEGDRIRVEVADDGKGLDRQAILAKAIERGMILEEEAATASSERILGCIFQPGFSTARTVTDISGRGVGMDVVKRAVEQMSGSVRVRSTRGAGTTVTISLPLTMAIITAVLVEASGAVCAIPLSSVREVLKVDRASLQTVANGRATLLRGQVLVVVNLGEALDETQSAPSVNGKGRRVVVVEREGRRLGLEVDRILGTQEIVIKSLSRHWREIQGLIGASLLGDGRIALIVDVEAIIRRHYRESGERAAENGGTATVTEVENAPAPRMAGAPAGAHASALSETTAAAASARTEPKETESPETGSPGADLPKRRLPEPQPAEPEPPAAEEPHKSGSEEAMDLLTLSVTGTRGQLLEEVNNSGAIRSSAALSQLTGRDIRVSFPESRVAPLAEVVSFLGGEEATVGGIYIGIQGELQGAILQVFPVANLPVIDDMLHGRPEGTTRSVSEIDPSALSEVGNVLAASFLAAIADATGLSIVPEVPEIAIDMCLPVVDSILARFALSGDQILLTNAVIYGDGIENVVCYFVLFLEPDSLERLVDVLESGSQVAAPSAED